jgi:hypothetical protein
MGEVFFADQSGSLPTKQILRGISRVFTGSIFA